MGVNQVHIEFIENLIVASTYWYFKNNCCRVRNDAIDVSGEAAWFSIAACVFWVSPHVRDTMPEFFNICIITRILYNVAAVAVGAHLLFCFLWIEFLTALSGGFSYLEKVAGKYRLSFLLDNPVVTMEPHCGYFNLFTILALLFWILTLHLWVNSCDVSDPQEEDNYCNLAHGCSRKRLISPLESFEEDPGERSPDNMSESDQLSLEQEEPAGPRTRARTRNLFT